MNAVGVRIQGLGRPDQVLVLARLAGARAEIGLFAAADIDELFDELSLPRPTKVSNQLAALRLRGLLTRVGGKRAAWTLTPLGRATSLELASDMDLAALVAESARGRSAYLGEMPHPEVPPSFAPPELIRPLRSFFDRHPFESNVFAMTRFPDAGGPDPLVASLEVAREVCRQHGLTLHLASDRKIVDGLWPNVMAHVWGSRYGVAFFEERTPDGLNYNLQIEVGSSLALGRRLAILKDAPVRRLPTDLVGQIYHEIDLDRSVTIKAQLHRWIQDDLNL